MYVFYFILFICNFLLVGKYTFVKIINRFYFYNKHNCKYRKITIYNSFTILYRNFKKTFAASQEMALKTYLQSVTLHISFYLGYFVALSKSRVLHFVSIKVIGQTLYVVLYIRCVCHVVQSIDSLTPV